MKEQIREYVERIFVDYEESQQLIELKEEIKANLFARIEDSVAEGCSEQEAFQLAIKELGDISAVADEMSLKTKYEVFEQMYTKKPLSKKHAFGYMAAAGTLLFGIIASPIVYFLVGNLFISVSTLFPFAVISIAAFVFLGLIQETDYHYGMKPLRAFFYTIATALLTFGVFTSLIVYLQRSGLNGQLESIKEIMTLHNEPLFTAVATLLPFVLPSICMFIFLGLTETDRTKPNMWSDYYKKLYTGDDESAVRKQMVYGNISGALWIFAIGFFLVIGFFGGWKYSWLVFIFAVGLQVLLEAYFAGKRIQS